MERKAFLDQEPPPGYVAGIGRGATGFTTRADTGNSKIDPGLVVQVDEDDDEFDEGDYTNDANGILVTKQDKDDQEAEKIYAEIEQRLKSKRRIQPTETDLVPNDVVDKFSDLKRALTSVTDDQWENLPEVGDLTRHNKRTRLLEQQQQRYYAVPDSVIAGNSLKLTNFQTISEARDKLLSNQLDNLVPQSSEVDNTLQDSLAAFEQENNDNKIADIKKGRLILSSLRKSEPNKANSWIASARLEEQAKNYNGAKKFIIEGCQRVPRNDDIWMENIRIHKNSAEGTKMCKVIVTEALKFNSRSEKLWLKAFELENSSDIVSRRKVIMRALEAIPTSVGLWKELINLEESPEDVTKLLHKAVELCPKELEFWLSLINLSDYKESKSLLNKARKALPGNHQVWLTAAKLEERESPEIDSQKLIKLLEKAFKEVSKQDTNISRSQWLHQAARAEEEGFIKTCEAIVINTLNSDTLEDNLTIWLHDASNFTTNSRKSCAKFVFQFIIDKFPTNIESWISLLSQQKDNLNSLFEYYSKAIALNPGEEIFPLMKAKDKWILANDVDSAREILYKANQTLQESENLWLARVKLEVKTFNYDEAQKISNLSIRKISNPSARVWYKHIHLLRCLQERSGKSKDKLIALVNESLEMHSECAKLYMQKAQIYLQDDAQSAREVLSIAVKRCPQVVELWIMLSKIDEQNLKVLIRARSVLDSGILQNPQDDKLWDARISLERRNNDMIAARQITNKALKTFPHSTLLWIQYLSLIPKMSQRKNAFLDAMKSTSNAAEILLRIGVFFWLDGKFSKAKSWFERGLNSDCSIGDCWAWMYLFVQKHGNDEEKEDLINRFNDAYEDINKGEVWNVVHKDIDNFEKSPVEILELVSNVLQKS